MDTPDNTPRVSRRVALLTLAGAIAGCTTTKTDKPRNPYNDEAAIMKRQPDRKYISAPDK